MVSLAHEQNLSSKQNLTPFMTAKVIKSSHLLSPSLNYIYLRYSDSLQNIQKPNRNNRNLDSDMSMSLIILLIFKYNKTILGPIT